MLTPVNGLCSSRFTLKRIPFAGLSAVVPAGSMPHPAVPTYTAG